MVAGSTVVDAINSDGNYIDLEGGDTTMKMGEARRASIMRNNGIKDSGVTQCSRAQVKPSPKPSHASPSQLI